MSSSNRAPLVAPASWIRGITLTACLAPPAVAQVAEQNLLMPATDGTDYVGYAIDRDGTTAAVGAPRDDHSNKNRPGAVHVLQKSGANWAPTAFVTGSFADSYDNFGCAVAFDGGRLIVGANTDDENGVVDCGSCYIFQSGPGGWTELVKLSAPNKAAADYFGSAVAIIGDTAYVGAPNKDIAPNSNAGAVYVFEYDRIFNAWFYITTLFAPTGQYQGEFGGALQADAAGLLVGSAGSNLGFGDAGAVHYFTGNSGVGWTHLQVLQAAPVVGSARFGTSLSLDGPRLVVGAPGSSGFGAAYVFELVGGTWNQTNKLVPFDVESNQGFGASVGVAGDRVAVGAPFDDATVGYDQGAIYLFDKSTWGWVETGKAVASNAALSDRLGSSVALLGAEVLAGAPYDDNALGGDTGSVYAFEMTGTLHTTPFGFCTAAVAPCNNPDPTGGCRNSSNSGTGAFLIDSGSASVVSDDLVLSCSRVPTNVQGVLYMGSAAISFPFANGVRCVGAGTTGTYRFGLQSSGTAGVIANGPGIVAWSQGHYPISGQIQGGQTWYFQVWYRDTAQTLCGTSNFSNAVAVTFAP